MDLTKDYSWAHKSSWLVCHIEYDTSLVQKNPQMSATKFLFFLYLRKNASQELQKMFMQLLLLECFYSISQHIQNLPTLYQENRAQNFLDSQNKTFL